jgi:hypothetical protein
LTVRYRLIKNISAIYESENTVSMIPVGGVVETLAPLPDLGLVRATYNGRIISAMARDLRESGTIGENNAGE